MTVQLGLLLIGKMEVGSFSFLIIIASSGWSPLFSRQLVKVGDAVQVYGTGPVGIILSDTLAKEWYDRAAGTVSSRDSIQ